MWVCVLSLHTFNLLIWPKRKKASIADAVLLVVAKHALMLATDAFGIIPR